MFSLIAAAMLTPSPAPLAEALAPRAKPVLVSYDVEMVEPELTWTARIYPHRPQGERIEVLSPPKTMWPSGTQKALTAYDQQADDDIWCDSVQELVGDEITTIDTSAERQRFGFAPKVTPDTDKAGQAFAKAARGEIGITATPDGWQVSDLRLYLIEPFKPAMIAKLTAFDLRISCAAAPDGRMYQQQTRTHTKGNAMGRSFDETEAVTIRNIVFAD